MCLSLYRKIGRDLLKMFWDNVLNIKSTNGRVILTEKINTSLFKFEWQLAAIFVDAFCYAL